MTAAAPAYPANLRIPVDLFVSKKRRCLIPGGDLLFTNDSGKLVFAVDDAHSSNTALSTTTTLPGVKKKILLLDASGNALISIYRQKNGSWQGFKKDLSGEQLIFRVEVRLNKFSTTELEAFLVGEEWEDANCSFKIKGFRFQRSCTIYWGNSIVAQSSLMYKLRTVFVGRCRFRVTIFPGCVDYALVVALLVIFLDT